MQRRQFVGAAAGALAASALTGCAGSLGINEGIRSPAPPAPTNAATFGAARRYVATRYGRIAYVERGKGDAALFLHGFPLNSFQWRGALDRLSTQRRCIAPDFLGLGYTQVAPGQSVAPDAQVSMLIELLHKLSVGSVDVVANDSGGAVAQLLLVMLRLWSEPGREDSNRCCTPQSVGLARRVSAQLDIPFYVVDARDAFRGSVIEGFLDGYARGTTPNPCLDCNRKIRWTLLLEHALGLGAERMATGHYARVEQGPDGTIRLLRARDLSKDQSYVLHVLAQDQLRRAVFPVGSYLKPEVRLGRNLLTANRNEARQPGSVLPGRRGLPGLPPAA